MPKIYKPYGERRPHRCSHPGNRMEPVYAERFDQDGNPYLRKTGEKDTYAEIQSYKESCDIHTLLQQYAAGDNSMVRQGVYMDISGLPNSYVDAFNQLAEMRDGFNKLPVAIREKFGHNFETYAKEAGTPEWAEKLGLVPRGTEGEVSKNES